MDDDESDREGLSHLGFGRGASTEGPRHAAEESGDEEERTSFGRHVLIFLRELLVVVVGAVIVASLLRGFVGQMFIIPSGSMETTLQIGDRVAVEKLSTVKRGHVVVFEDPGGWLSGQPEEERGGVGKALEFIGVLPDTGTGHLIKRVVGLPGDEVECCDEQGRILVNGQPLDEEPYLYSDGGQSVDPSLIEFDVVVPKDRMFVLGDHRDASRDSRCHLHDPGQGQEGMNAFVPLDLVVGHSMAVVWPLDHAHRLPIPDTYESIPPGKAPVGEARIEAGEDADC